MITERLIIRQFTENDYIDLYEYLSDKQTYKYEPGKPITSIPPLHRFSLFSTRSITELPENEAFQVSYQHGVAPKYL
jgi:RimJ/RimL family protein N-acetyltransferase